ncbi:hypothetical protein AB4304_01885 [Vibrio breoganii]
MSKILITTRYFYPKNTPRAHRAFELAKQFARDGKSIVIITRDYSKEHKEITKHYGVEFHYTNKKQVDDCVSPREPKKKPSNIRRTLSNILYYLLPEGKEFLFSLGLYKELDNLSKYSDKYILIFSNSFPFSVHIGTFLFLDKLLAKDGVSIAEMSDPYFYNHKPKAFYLKYMERYVLNKFDYISVPTDESRELYSDILNKDNVYTVPQGFEIKELKYDFRTRDNNCKRFIFAGRLYEQIRNPKEYLGFLSSLDIDFLFTMYVDMDNTETMDMINDYRKLLGSKLKVLNFIPRNELIIEMSKQDFLVNFENVSGVQQPSKLIDYGISGRPILNLSTSNVDYENLVKFLNGDYSDALCIDINKYKIENVTSKIYDLMRPS